MLFRKLYFPPTPLRDNKSVEGWYLILRTPAEILRYMEVDAELSTQAMLAIPASISRSHLEGSRERVITAMLQTKLSSLGENEKLYPINVVADLVNSKGRTMLKLLGMGEEILVQQNGSYSNYSGFAKCNNTTVVEELERDTLYYPTDALPIATDLLYLENSERVPVDFEHEVDAFVGRDYNNGWTAFNEMSSRGMKHTHENIDVTKKVKYKISHLKLRDPKFVAGMISMAKVIAFESQLTDHVQIDKMIQLFAQLRGKTVIIKSGYSRDIKSHELFEECSARHTIIFI